jgi:phosphatidylglycerol:prolipoprotein diacylglycerol transferase
MNGITVNINPVIFQFGHFALRWYGVFIVAAIVAAVMITARETRRKGLPDDLIQSIAPWLLVAGIVGARLFHVVDQWSFYSQNPGLIFQFQQGGLAIYGALAGGGMATFLYTRVKRVPLATLLDAMVPGLLVAQMIGRLGCLVNGDAYGSVTTLPWGLRYINPGAMIPSQFVGLPTHPYPVYDILWNGLALLFFLKFRDRVKQDGLVFLAYVSLYSIGRFAISFVRQENQWFWGLQEAQVIALVALLASAAVYFFYFARRSDGRRNSLPGYAA